MAKMRTMGPSGATARFSRVLLVTALAGGMLFSRPLPASACSCASTDARTALERAGAAFVGVYLGRDDPQGGGEISSSGRPVVNHFRVEQALKGGLGDRVDVDAPADGASCGLELSVGDRTGLFLTREGDRWVSGLCSQIEPERLLDATKPLPDPTSSKAVAFVVSGKHGPNRLIALDVDGEIVAYGAGEGGATTLSVCPGGSHLLELFSVNRNDRQPHRVPHVGVRRVQDLALVSEHPLDELFFADDNQRDVRSLSCRDPQGDNALIFAVEGVDEDSRGRIVRLRGGGGGGGGTSTTLWEGAATTAGFSAASDAAYVTVPLSSTREQLVIVDLATGKGQGVGEFSTWTGPFVPSPDGTRLAAVTYSPPLGPDSPPSQVVLVDLTVDPPRLHSAKLGRSNVAGKVVWLAGDRIVFAPTTGDADDVRVYDTSLQQLAAWEGWSGGYDIAAMGGRLVGTGSGSVTCLDPETGASGALRSFGDASLVSVAVVLHNARPAKCSEQQLEPAPTSAIQESPSTEPSPTTAVELATKPSGSSSDPTLPAAGATAGLGLAIAGFFWTRRFLRRPTV